MIVAGIVVLQQRYQPLPVHATKKIAMMSKLPTINNILAVRAFALQQRLLWKRTKETTRLCIFVDQMQSQIQVGCCSRMHNRPTVGAHDIRIHDEVKIPCL
jgi:hypothetical protein